MEVRFLDHALRRMRERNLSPAFIQKVIAQPDKVERSVKDPARILYKKRYSPGTSGERLLLIITEAKEKMLIVVTVIETSKIEKYW